VLKLEKREDRNQFHDRFTQLLQRPWTAKDQPDFAGWLKANEKPLKLVVEATKRLQYFNPITVRRTEQGPHGLISALMPTIGVCREMANALAARAMLHTGEGRFEEAWQDLLACHRLGRLVARGSTLIELLVGNALDRIASTADLAFIERTGFTSERLRACLGDLQQLPRLPGLVEKLDRAERYMGLDAIQLMERYGFDDLNGGSLSPKKPLSSQDRAILDQFDWDLMLRDANLMYTRLVATYRVEKRSERTKLLAALSTEYVKRVEKSAADKDELKGLKGMLAGRKEVTQKVSQAISDVMLGLLVPMHHRGQQSVEKAEQTQRNLRVAIALAAYHRDHKSYPKQLADLTPKYLKEVPEDLFSGKGLIYRPFKEGHLLYSVGVNGKDDAGRTDRDQPLGDDLSIRMPLSDLPRK
jgi:hypothetical protein